MRLITSCLLIYQAVVNGATIQTQKRPPNTVTNQLSLAQVKAKTQALAKATDETTSSSTTSSQQTLSEQCYDSVYTLYTDQAIENNPSSTVIEYSNGFCSDNSDAVEKSIVPYYCFYTGYNLLYQIQLERDAIKKKAGTSEPNTQELFDAKKEIVSRFCDDFQYGAQERTLFLEDFYDIPEQELAQSDCVEYLAVNYDHSKAEFDPIDMTEKLEKSIICAQEYAMVEALRKTDLDTLTETVRFSYVVSLESGNEAFQVLDYARCTEQESSQNPAQFCTSFYNWDVNFSMWSQLQTEKVCQRIAESLKSREHMTKDSCAFITSRVYQLYSWYLQDVSDSIISEQISTLNDEYQEEIDKFRAEAENGKVQQVDDVSAFIGNLLDNETVQKRIEKENLEDTKEQAEEVDEFIDETQTKEYLQLEQQAAEVQKLLDQIMMLEKEQQIKQLTEQVKGEQEKAEQARKEYEALVAQAAEVEKLLDEIKQLEEQTQINDQIELEKQAKEVEAFIDDVEEQEDIQEQQEQEAQELLELEQQAKEATAFIEYVKVLEDKQKEEGASEEQAKELIELEKQAQNVQKFIDDVAALEESQSTTTTSLSLLKLAVKAVDVQKFDDSVKLLQTSMGTKSESDSSAKKNSSLENTQPQLVKVTNTGQSKRQSTLPWGDSQQQQQPQQLVQQTQAQTSVPMNGQMAQSVAIQQPTSNIAVQLPQTQAYMQQQPQQLVYSQPQQANQQGLVYVQSVPQAQANTQQMLPQQTVYSTVQLPQYRY